MSKLHSLRARILLLKAIVLLPVLALLGVQTWQSTASRLEYDRLCTAEIISLIARLDPSALELTLANPPLPQGSQLIAVDSQGLILAPRAWQGRPAADHPAFHAMARQINLGDRSDDHSSDHNNTATQEFKITGSDHIPRLYSAHPWPGAGHHHSHLWLALPGPDLYATALRAFLNQTLPILILAFLLLLFSWKSSKRLLLEPIERLRDAAAKIGKGEFSTRTHLRHGDDELGLLAASIDDMASTLDKSERWRNLVLEAAELGTWDLDLITNRSYRNLRHNQIFGYNTPQHEWDAGLFFKHVLPEDLGYIRERYAHALTTGQHDLEIRIHRADGALRWINIKGQVLFDEQKHPVRMVGIVADITERKQAELEQKKLNRTLHLLSEANEALLRVRNERELLDTICRLITTLGGYRLAWVGFVSPEATQHLIPMAQSGIDSGIDHGTGERIQLDKAAQTSGYGPTDTALQSAQPVVVQDIRNDPIYAPWRDEAIQRGFLATIVMPLTNKDGVIGTMSIYSAETNTFDAQEIGLLEKLASNLAYGIGNLRETGKRERYERQLDHQSRFDSLTDLPNRAQFIDRLQLSINEAQRTGSSSGSNPGSSEHPLAVLLLDLDRFKTINDTLGHGAGDQLLQLIAQRLAHTLREGDAIGRLAVDEFAIIINNMSPGDDIAPFANRLLQIVAEPLTLLEREIYITASIGISFYPHGGEDAEALLQGTYAAMYNAKEQGGNAFQFYAQDMNQHLSKRLALESALRRTLEQGGLQLYYQPKIDLSSNAIIGAEALLRWQHPELGMVSPAEFIPLAEETGLIVPIGAWVLDTACQQIRTWLDAGLPAPPIAVNLSARQFRQENIAQLVQNTLLKHRIHPSLLILEITESTAMFNVEKAIAILNELKQIGVKLALDDFGTGYSSLSYLKRLPLDQLKIDRSFVRDITTDPDDATICLAVVGLGHNLKLSVVAEGVETEGQKQFLRDHHCDEMQGFLFSRPIPSHDFAAMLKAPAHP
jgi:diguanylate cyclase (GGDEF)-like protein/PAS domain S-box-containing protein